MINSLLNKSGWLNDFNQEYVNANFNHKGKRLHKKKIEVRTIKSTGKKRKFDVGKKACYDANNKRNNDIFSVKKATGLLHYDLNEIDVVHKESVPSHVNEVEDSIIEKIDLTFKKVD